jgi:hypothetical protein
MQKENWAAISKAVQLEDSDRAVLAKVQARLALNNEELRQFMLAMGKLSPVVAKLRSVRLNS